MRLVLLLTLALLACGVAAPGTTAHHACHPDVEPLCLHVDEDLVPLTCRILGPWIPIEGCN